MGKGHDAREITWIDEVEMYSWVFVHFIFSSHCVVCSVRRDFGNLLTWVFWSVFRAFYGIGCSLYAFEKHSLGCA